MNVRRQGSTGLIFLRAAARAKKVDSIMGRKIQVCALSLIAAFGYTTSAFAQAAPADAPKPADPAAAPAAEPAPV